MRRHINVNYLFRHHLVHQFLYVADVLCKLLVHSCFKQSVQPLKIKLFKLVCIKIYVHQIKLHALYIEPSVEG